MAALRKEVREQGVLRARVRKGEPTAAETVGPERSCGARESTDPPVPNGRSSSQCPGRVPGSLRRVARETRHEFRVDLGPCTQGLVGHLEPQERSKVAQELGIPPSPGRERPVPPPKGLNRAFGPRAGREIWNRKPSISVEEPSVQPVVGQVLAR